MKKLLLLLLLYPVIGFSQVSTTEEEYAYLTKGIREQYAKGMDVKKDGYTLEKFFESKNTYGKSVISFYKFIDKEGNLKAISIMRKQPNGDASSGYYMCYPINNEKLYSKFDKYCHQNAMDNELVKATNEALIHLLNEKK